MNSKNPARSSFLQSVKGWFISSSNDTVAMDGDPERIDWTRGVPYIAIHLAPLAIFWTGWSWPAVIMAVLLYALRVFTLTGFYHPHSDDEQDIHSPRQKGFWFAHMGWFLTPRSLPTNYRLIPDFAKFPELR